MQRKMFIFNKDKNRSAEAQRQVRSDLLWKTELRNTLIHGNPNKI